MTRILLRRGTAAQWEASDPVLFAGEPGFEVDTDVFKIGDGTTAWNDLDGITGGTGGTGGGVTSDQLLLALRTTDANAREVSGAYPTRASVTTDALRRVRWIGTDAPTISATYATNGFDVWEAAP